MKILYVTSQLSDSGGVSRVLSVKLNYLVEHLGHEVVVASTNDQEHHPFFSFHPAIRIYWFSAHNSEWFNLKKYRDQIQSCVKVESPDIVVVADNGLKGLLVKRMLPKSLPCVYELHASKTHFLNQSYTGWKNKLFQWLSQQLLPEFDTVVVLQKAYLLDFLPISHQKVVPNPLVFSSVASSTLTHKKAIAVGRAIALKGYDRMLKAWHQLVLRYPEYHLDIYGAPSEEVDVAELIQQWNLQEHVTLHLPTNDIQLKYAEADFLMHASYSEAFPMVFLEAMQCGLPVVYFDLEHIDFLTSKNSIAIDEKLSFVEQVERLINDFSFRKSLGTQARQDTTGFQLIHVMPQWEALFQALKSKSLYKSNHRKSGF